MVLSKSYCKSFVISVVPEISHITIIAMSIKIDPSRCIQEKLERCENSFLTTPYPNDQKHRYQSPQKIHKIAKYPKKQRHRSLMFPRLKKKLNTLLLVLLVVQLDKNTIGIMPVVNNIKITDIPSTPSL